MNTQRYCLKTFNTQRLMFLQVNDNLCKICSSDSNTTKWFCTFNQVLAQSKEWGKKSWKMTFAAFAKNGNDESVLASNTSLGISSDTNKQWNVQLFLQTSKKIISKVSYKGKSSSNKLFDNESLYIYSIFLIFFSTLWQKVCPLSFSELTMPFCVYPQPDICTVTTRSRPGIIWG